MDSEDQSPIDAAVEDDQIETNVQLQNYAKVLKEDEFRERMESHIQIVSEIYSIPKAEATLLLPDFRRDPGKFNKKWFNDEKSVRESVGILERPLDNALDPEFCCGVCVTVYPIEKSASVSCGQRVCTYCWTRHINNIINDSPASGWILLLKCPYVSCQASVGRDMIERFASGEEKSKYNRYLLKSYVEDTKTMNLCLRATTGRSCGMDLSADSEFSAVYCVCLLKFCWNCLKDVHRPVDCETAARWLATMNNPGNQNPSWLSRGDWSEDDEETCNDDAISYEEADQQWQMAESATDRYKDCYENWERHELLMQKAKAKLEGLDTTIQNLSDTQLATKPQLEFIVEAVLQIMECRRVLKWTYAYEYYLREDEVEKQEFLKQTREDANRLLEKLHNCVESELPLFLDEEEPSQNFNNFRISLTQLTSIMRNHYELLVRDLENGLPNVVPAPRAHDEEASGSGVITKINQD